jgi:acetolactate synthase-1/2/3 large subunit
MYLKTAEAIIRCLHKENVEVIFGYPGGAVIPIYDSLRQSEVKHVLVRHEQAAGHCANGYARAMGKTGVCIGTSGPGATNLITAIANAYMDSIPIVVITGQVNSRLIGKDVFQEADIIGSTASFTKHSYLVKDGEEIPRIMKEAFHIASTGRPGPVIIDIPIDVQNQEIDFEYPKEIDIKGYKPKINGHKLQIRKAIDVIKGSKKPLICIGGGVIAAKAQSEMRQFIHKARIPAIHTLMGKGSIVDESPYYMGLIGSHGYYHSNKALANADVLILIGARAADRAISNKKFFPQEAMIIHIDIDPAEIGKNLNSMIPVVGDAKNIIKQMIDEIEPLDTELWLQEIKSWKKPKSKALKSSHGVDPKFIFYALSETVEKDAILFADVGQNQIWAAHNYIIQGDRKYFTSGGLGTMGYAIPASIGAKVGMPQTRVIAVMGDGGFQMSFNELGTIIQENLNIIFLMFNNNMLGMVKELQINNYKRTYGVELNNNPDFIKIFEAYGLPGKKVKSNEEFKNVLYKAMASEKAFLIECLVEPNLSTLY